MKGTPIPRCDTNQYWIPEHCGAMQSLQRCLLRTECVISEETEPWWMQQQWDSGSERVVYAIQAAPIPMNRKGGGVFLCPARPNA